MRLSHGLAELPSACKIAATYEVQHPDELGQWPQLSSWVGCILAAVAVPSDE